MRKWIKWGLIFVFLHFFIFTMPLYIYKIPGKYGAVLFLPTFIIYIFEAPIFLINAVLSIAVDYADFNFVFLNFIFGAILYFFIGAIIAYVREKPKN